MKDTAEASGDSAPGRRWLLFIHQLPPKPDYLRVKTRRRLRRLGAVPVKPTVYALASTEDALEDLQWLRHEIEAELGSAVIAEAEFIEGISDEELDAMLASARPGAERNAPWQGAADQIEPGLTWVTREHVHVDRIASAWLIRRFIDPEARFKFVAPEGYAPRRGELRFDMFEAEYTHEGDRCTFETLLRRFRLRDPALRAIGEIVHDIDCKDTKFDRTEAAGVERLLGGIARESATDTTRLRRGGAVFDNLYQSFLRSRGGSAVRGRR